MATMGSSTGHGVSEDAIAIIGMSCRLSGVATSPEGLWQMLSKGLTGWTNSAGSRFRLDAFWHPQGDLNGSFNTRGLHLIQQDPALFDNGFFGISNIEAKAIDPQHRMMLEVAYEAFEDAGIRMEDLPGSDTAVFCAISNHDYEKILGRDGEVSPGYRFTGTGPSMLANRVSYFFDLRGPSITLDTACSSGLVALHEACKSIRNGEVKQALVGGSNLILDPDQITVMSSMSFLSPHGRCYSFDSRADGFGRGEGVAAVMLKSLDQALRDGDAIRAVIRGSSVVQDGRTPGITMPSCEAQMSMIEKVYKQAKLSPKDTVYVEAHGTGTTAGDKIEATALKETFCKDRQNSKLLLGSVKANVGHTESVAGLAGVIKAVLMLEKGFIPPNPTFVKPSEKLPIDEWNMEVPTSMIPWPEHTVRRASVNSFGYGGTNGHVILEAATDYLGQDYEASNQKKSLESPKPRLFVFSHGQESGVREAAAKLKRFVANLDGTSQSLDSLAFTLTRRSMLEYRVSVTAATQEELLEGLETQATAEDRISSITTPPKLCFAFTGQGAQWPGMARELLSTSPVFADSMKRTEQTLLQLGADWRLIEELCKLKDSRINEAALSQPVCTAIQIALVDLLTSWNVLPIGVVGHSSGEMAAAYAAGLLSAEDAVKAAYHRGESVKKLKARYPELRGAMLAAGISATDAQMYLMDGPADGKAVVACINSPSSVTISGDDVAVSAVQAKLAVKELFNRKLVVEAAYHSHHMELVQDDYYNSIQSLECGQRKPGVRMVSSVHGMEVKDGDLDAAYWCKNLTSPVRFVDAVTGILEAVREEEKGPIVVVEIGPHSALAGPIKQIIKAAKLQGVDYLSVITRKEDAGKTAVATAGQLFQRGYEGLDFDAINYPSGSTAKHLLSDLPRYGWTHKTSHWSESRRSAHHRLRKFPRHDLLGTLGIDSISEEPTWRNYLRLQEQPWLTGHTIGESIVFPAAGYLAMAVEANKQLTLNDDKPWKNMKVKFQNVTFGSALIISEDAAVETVFALRPHAGKNGWKEFRVFSIANNGESTEHCRGMTTVEAQGGRQRDLTDTNSVAFMDEVSKESQLRIEPRKLYQELKSVGLDYTGLFASQEGIRASQSGAVCCVRIPDAQATMPSKHQQSHCIHPSTLDVCIQSVFPVMKTAGLLGSSVVVSSIKSLEIHSEIPSKPGQELDVTTKLRQYGRSKVIANTVVARSRLGKSSVFMKVGGLVLASSGGPLQPGPSQRPVAESLTHRLKWSIDPSFAQPQTVLNHCQLDQAELMARGPNHICAEYSKILIHKTLAWLDPQDEHKIKGHFSKLLQWMKANNVECNDPILANESSIEAQAKAAGAHGECLVHIGPHLAGVLSGEVDALGLLQQDNRLYSLYSYQNYDRAHRQLAKYVQFLQFKNPNMRILEIGAGTASTTMPILEALSARTDCSGRPKLDRYTFTDISTGFFEKAEQKLEGYTDLLEFKKLDIENPPAEQGIELGSYDLIIATNVLHATMDIENTLGNVRSLLKPNGQLALMEFTVSTLHTGLIFGMLPGWWLSVDGRQGGPLQSVTRWNEKLRRTGFSGVDVELPDYANSEHEMSLLISTASGEMQRSNYLVEDPHRQFSVSTNVTESSVDGSQSPVSLTASPDGTTVSTPSLDGFYEAQVVQIVHGDAEKRIAEHLSELLIKSRVPSKPVTLANLSPENQRVVFLLESVSPFLTACSEKEWEKVRKICQLATGVLWVTVGAAIESSNPMGSLITGLSRCLRTENQTIQFVTLDLEAKTDLETTPEWEVSAAAQVCNVYQGSLQQGPQPLMEWEYAIRGGEVLIPRLIEDVETDSYILDNVSKFHPQQETALKSDRALGLNIQVPGLLDTLYWADSEKHSLPVKSEEVRVKLEYISLNFKDIMIAMGQLDGHTTLLLEGTGKVIEVGDSMAPLYKVGDSVYVRDFDGLATTANIHKSNIHHVPSNVDLEVPAAVGIAYATAWYALVSRGDLQDGDSVLIHSGAGAVGQATITIAQHVCKTGQIFVTVGTDEKREFIKSKFGIPDENIFSSRGLDFYQGILSRTNGEGVDVVLNSLSGEALQKSVELLTTMGRFVEIGKKDLLSTDSRLEMWALEKNVQFSSVDLTLVGRKRPAQLHDIFCTVFDLLAENKIATVSPITAKPVSELEEAFRLMQAGQHMGKLLIKLDPESPLMVQPSKPKVTSLRSDSTYFVVGGTGGLGKATLRLLATLGAKRLVTLSRSGSDSKTTREMIDEMAGRGVEITVHKGSVLSKADIEKVKEHCKEYPVRGVVQGAMVLQDCPVEKMTHEQWRAAVEPKVEGTWNIHEVFGGSLDFFVLLSSSGGIIGSFSQGNYCAGNTFQDAFARYRAGLGFSGRSIDVGFVEGEGYTAENEAAADFVRRQGLSSYKLDEFLVTIEEAIRNPIAATPTGAQLICGVSRADPSSQTKEAALQNPDPKFSHVWRKAAAQEQRATNSSQVDVQAVLRACENADEAYEVTLDAIKAKLARLLAIPVEETRADRSIASHGMDSLIAVELRNWISTLLEAQVQMFELMSSMPFSDLAMTVAKRSRLIPSELFAEK